MKTSLRFPAGLYGVTPDWDDTPRLLAAVSDAAAGGMSALQLRRKNVQAEILAEQAMALAKLCHELGVVFIVNDHWRLARAIGADGVHLGRHDDTLEYVREQCGPDLLIGVSCYNDLDRARAMLAAGVDYIAFGAMFPSATKPDAAGASLDLLAHALELAEELPAPRPAIVAIGGITPANAAWVAQAGADSIAVISGLFDTPNIRTAARGCAAPFTVQPLIPHIYYVS